MRQPILCWGLKVKSVVDLGAGLSWAIPPGRDLSKIRVALRSKLWLPVDVMNTKSKSTTPEVYVGLDVHKSSITVAYALPDGSNPVVYGKLGGSNLALERGLARLRKKLGVEKSALRVCYEAGPTGFVAARRLIELRYDTIVVAPSKIQRAAGERIKTDRKDAVKLARLLRSGDLEGIHIPVPDDEAIRDVCRARTDASEDRRKAKQRLSAFLLRNGIHYSGKSKWTAAHMRYLRDLKLPSDAQQIVLEEGRQAIDSAHERAERLADHLERLLLDWERSDYVLALMAMRGFKLVAAMTIISELGDLARFRHPRQRRADLGLVPGERATGSRRRQGSITKDAGVEIGKASAGCRGYGVDDLKHAGFKPHFLLHVLINFLNFSFGRHLILL